MSADDPAEQFGDSDVETDLTAGDPTGSVPARGETPRVLIVEDEPVVRADIQLTLTDAGYCVAHAVGSLDDAMDRLRSDPGAVDFVLLDAQLSGQSCLPLANFLEASGVPHLIVSGHDELEIRAVGLKAPYLGKPFGELQLIAAMQRHLPLPSSADKSARR